MAEEPRRNRLAGARSPYLRDAAEQPVDWHEWGEEAFEKARREDKPLLLDVGAVWCHWCHVMDHESYEDANVARLINEKFVPVKVDRDERPDVDARYQRLVSAITGMGGWPLTGFLTPDGDVFYGGTYFPPRDAHGRPGFPRVLEAVAEAFTARRDEVVERATGLTRAVAERVIAPRTPQPGAADVVTDKTVSDAVARILSEFDAVNGGFGEAPKFPHPSTIALLLRRLQRADGADRERLEEVTRTTLTAIARGGIRDHVGGGFHRYSVDAEWIVPHFEKMLYDNAEFLRNYAFAARVLGDPLFAEAAWDTARFLTTTLADAEHGGFKGSQDADVGPHDDGDYFTWTLEELNAAVPDKETARVLAMHYAVEEHGDMHHDPARNVLHVDAEPADIAAGLHMDEDEVRRRIEDGLAALRVARGKREAPFVDPTIYVNWNGMAASAVLQYAGLLEDTDAQEAALRAIDRVVSEAYTDGEGFAHVAGEGGVKGLLDDNAQMLQALLDAFDVTGDTRHLRTARAVADILADAFWSDEHAAFLSYAPAIHESAGPALPPEPVLTDSPSPSAGGVAALSLLRLEAVTGEARYGDLARRAIEAATPQIAPYGVFGAQFLLAADAMRHPGVHVVIGATGAEADALRAAALRVADPARTIAVVDPSNPEAPVPQEAADALHASGEGVAIVCVGTRCLAPARGADELDARIAQATGVRA